MCKRTPVTLAVHAAAARVLGLRPLPSAAEIKAAYRQHAKRFHPDVAEGHVDSEAKFREVRAAYETLQRPTMSENARKLLTPDQRGSTKDELRRYHANASSSGASLKVMTALLLGMTSYLAYTLHHKKRLPHQRGYSLSSLWADRGSR
jgi:preprotein translocase subunit Sec63